MRTIFAPDHAVAPSSTIASEASLRQLSSHIHLYCPQLFLRAEYRASAAYIRHVPLLLIHWRIPSHLLLQLPHPLQHKPTSTICQENDIEKHAPPQNLPRLKPERASHKQSPCPSPYLAGSRAAQRGYNFHQFLG